MTWTCNYLGSIENRVERHFGVDEIWRLWFAVEIRSALHCNTFIQSHCLFFTRYKSYCTRSAMLQDLTLNLTAIWLNLERQTRSFSFRKVSLRFETTFAYSSQNKRVLFKNLTNCFCHNNFLACGLIILAKYIWIYLSCFRIITNNVML